MRSYLYAATVLSVAVVLVLTQRATPFDGFHSLTAASYLLPSTFLLIGVASNRTGIISGVRLAMLSGVALGVMAVAIIYTHGYPISPMLVVTVLVLMSAYAVGGMLSSFLAWWLRSIFFVRFYAASLAGAELTRIMALVSLSLLYGNLHRFESGIDTELLFGFIICIPYALCGSTLRALIIRSELR